LGEGKGGGNFGGGGCYGGGSLGKTSHSASRGKEKGDWGRKGKFKKKEHHKKKT